MVWLGYQRAWGGLFENRCFTKNLDNLEISAELLQPIRFQGQFYDPENRLHYNRFRYYDYDVGMFIQRDPIGLLGGNNVFAYAPNPVSWIDPLGLVVKIVTDDKVAYNRIKESYAKLVKTKKGREITKTLENSSTIYQIKVIDKDAYYVPPNAKCNGKPCEAYTVYVDPYNSLVLPTARGNLPTSLAVLLGHELGHATGTLDDGSGFMNNVNANENPIRKQLGLPKRTAYTVPTIIWKKGHIR